MTPEQFANSLVADIVLQTHETLMQPCHMGGVITYADTDEYYGKYNGKDCLVVAGVRFAKSVYIVETNTLYKPEQVVAFVSFDLYGNNKLMPKEDPFHRVDIILTRTDYLAALLDKVIRDTRERNARF